MKHLYLFVLVFLISLSSFSFAGTPENDHSKYQIYKLDPYVSRGPNPGYRRVWSSKKHWADLPPSADLSDKQSAVKNQGQRGSCAFFSATAMMEFLLKDQQGEEINVSEEYLIYYAKAIRHDSTMQEGSSSYDNMRAFKEGGFILERDLPYQPTWFQRGLPCGDFKDTDTSAPLYCFSHRLPEGLSDKVIPIHALKVKQLYPSNSEEQNSDLIVKELAKGVPVLIGIPVNQDGWNASTGSVYYNEDLKKACDADPKPCGGHSVLLVGYDLEKKELLFKNSWGSDWGNKGYGTMPFEYVDKWGSSNPVVAKLYLPLDTKLPENHNVILPPTFTNSQITINENADKKIKVEVSGELKYIPNALIYMSTFVTYDSLGSDTLLELPLPLREKYNEKNVRGPFYYFLKEGQVTFNIETPAVMEIPYDMLDKTFLKDKSVKLRISIYYHNDLNAWGQIVREWHPITLENLE